MDTCKVASKNSFCRTTLSHQAMSVFVKQLNDCTETFGPIEIKSDKSTFMINISVW